MNDGDRDAYSAQAIEQRPTRLPIGSKSSAPGALPGMFSYPGPHAEGLQMYPDALSARLRRDRAADQSTAGFASCTSWRPLTQAPVSLGCDCSARAPQLLKHRRSSPFLVDVTPAPMRSSRCAKDGGACRTPRLITGLGITRTTSCPRGTKHSRRCRSTRT